MRTLVAFLFCKFCLLFKVVLIWCQNLCAIQQNETKQFSWMLILGVEWKLMSTYWHTFRWVSFLILCYYVFFCSLGSFQLTEQCFMYIFCVFKYTQKKKTKIFFCRLLKFTIFRVVCEYVAVADSRLSTKLTTIVIMFLFIFGLFLLLFQGCDGPTRWTARST